MADVYEEPIVMDLGNCIARVYRPILTEEERKIRMKRVEKAASDLMKEVIDAGKYMAM